MSVSLPPPAFFSFKACDWPTWKSNIELYFIATGLQEKDDLVQVSTLQYLMGPRCSELLSSLNPSDDEKAKFEDQLKLFDNHFMGQKNVIYERVLFNRRLQRDGETVDNFIVAVHSQAEKCDYQNLKEDLIRDRIIVGIKDQALSKTLMVDPKMTLAKAIEIIRQHDEIRRQRPLAHLGAIKALRGSVQNLNIGDGSSQKKKAQKKGKGKGGNSQGKAQQPSGGGGGDQ